LKEGNLDLTLSGKERAGDPPPGNSDHYQNKGFAGGAMRMNVKTKEIGKLDQAWPKESLGRRGRGGAALGATKAHYVSLSIIFIE